MISALQRFFAYDGRAAAAGASLCPDFALDPARSARIALPARPDAGFFHCAQMLALAPGTYECCIEADFAAAGPVAARVEAVGWRDQLGEVLARARWPKRSSGQMAESARLRLKLREPARIELRGYAGPGYAAAVFVGGYIRRLDGDTAASLSDDLYAGPGHRLKWVVIGTTSICNASCPSCPTNKPSTAHVPRAHMEWPLYRRIIDGLSAIDIVGHVSFGLFGDSLLDPLVVQRAAYLKQRLPGVRLVLTSNGRAATERLARELGRYVDEFSFHVEAADPALYGELMQPLRAAEVLPRIERFISRCARPVNISCPVSRRNIAEFPRLSAHWLERGAARVHPLPLNGRCTETLGFADLAIGASPGRCRGDIVSNLIVDADGAVLACCEDFQRRGVIGDLNLETPLEALAGRRRQALAAALHAGRWADLPACATCLLGDMEETNRLLAALPSTAPNLPT